MNVQRATVRAPNGLLFICDRDSKDYPDVDGKGSFWRTPSMIALACEIDCEGPAEVVIGPMDRVSQPSAPLLDDVIETPSLLLTFELVPNTIVLETLVKGVTTRLRVWTNHPSQPDMIVIGLSEAA